jgi:hypothetical protein
MKVNLTSGAWVEMRGPGELMAGDKLALHESTVLPVAGSGLEDFAAGLGTFNLPLGMMDLQLYGVLDSLVQGWSYPYCLPRDDDNVDDKGRRTWADSLKRLPIDDWNEIEEAVQPHMDKLRSSPKGRKTTSSRSSSTSAARDVNSPRG